MMRPENFRSDTRELVGMKVSLTSYKMGDRFYCHIDNIDPGATIVRADGTTQDEAEQLAVAKAIERLTSKTKRS
ncbi:MAG: hypothetical protein HY707_11860 [Ignavibacteriae bacterium]|nr:hypothetical protein [Ignavibacteriota bacterium]